MSTVAILSSSFLLGPKKGGGGFQSRGTIHRSGVYAGSRGAVARGVGGRIKIEWGEELG